MWKVEKKLEKLENGEKSREHFLENRNYATLFLGTFNMLNYHGTQKINT